MKKLTNAQVKAYIEGFYNGDYTIDELPFELFDFTSTELMRAFEVGFGSKVLTDAELYAVDTQRWASFRDNLFYFSGNKTHAQALELQALLNDGNGNRRSLFNFTKDALEIDAAFNKRYLEAEYDLANKLATQAKEWREIEETKETFPMLQWVTVMDSNTRHAKFNGITLPVDDPFWDNYPQPLEWGCRCRKRQLTDADPTSASVIADLLPPTPRPWHANPWRRQAIFKNTEHPYGQSMTSAGTKAVDRLVTRKRKDYEQE